MSRKLTSATTLENLKREAKRWLKALRAADAAARARFERAHPAPPDVPGLRDVQFALAREYGFPGWTDLGDAVARGAPDGTDPRMDAAREIREAAGRGDVARVGELLDRRPDLLNERTVIPGHDGARTVLHHAIAHADVVRLLLERGADPNIRDEGDDAMPLHFAAERGDLEVVKLLVEHGADTIGDGTMHELNVLGWAICWDYTHQLKVAEYLLEHGARHTIHTAVAMGDIDAIRDIVAEDGAALERPMDRTNHRRHPLHLAVVKNQPAALATLLELGADPDAEDAAGLTALDQSALNGRTDLADTLLAHGAELRLPAAVALGRSADVERLANADPSQLAPGRRYATLIVRAATRSSGDIVRALIRAGADPNVRDDPETAVDSTTGYTALHEAAFHGNADAVQALLEAGADPNVRETKWRATAAGWASYAGHEAVCDQILAARIDLFQCVDFDRADRIPEIVRQSPWLLKKRFRHYFDETPGPDAWWPEPWHTPLAWAVARGKVDAARALLKQGAAQPPAPDGRTLAAIAREAGHDEIGALLDRYRRIESTHEGRVRWFVKNATPDHAVRGRSDHAVALHTAERMLRRHPEIARDSFSTAVICGDVAAIERALRDRPELANTKGGPKGREPLLYLCFTRLPNAGDHALEIARLLLDYGADPNAFFMAGDSRYTPLVGATGAGEEDRPAHAQRDGLTRLLLEHGAEPYDTQVLYNLHFHGDVLWFLERIHEASLRRGRAADWEDPEWRVLDMGGYGTGARYVLGIAVARNDLALAEWALAHGANPESPPQSDPRWPNRSLHEEAVRRGHTALAELLVRYGATPARIELDDEEEFVDACLRMDHDEITARATAHPGFLRSPKAIRAAAERDRADVVALLLDAGVPLEIENAQKQRPLHIAAWQDAIRVAELLIKRGAEIDPRESEWQNTPLDFAVYGQHARMIELLSRYSYDIWNLVFVGKVERVRTVLEERPELARLAAENSTPLMWLPDDESAAVAIVKLFLEHGADVSIRDGNGLSAADHAGRRGLEEAAQLLS